MEPKRTRHQEKIIKNFYRNRSDIALQRAQELITELYLAQGKKRSRVWENLVTHLEALGLPADQIAHLRSKDDPALVAQIIQKMA